MEALTSYRPLMQQLLLLTALALLLVTQAPADETADAAMQTGTDAFERGDFQQALIEFENAALEFREAENVDKQIVALTRSAEAHLALGQNTAALGVLEHTLALAKTTENAAVIATVSNTLGTANLRAGQVKAARFALETSVGMAGRAGDKDLLAAALNNLGNLHAGQRNFEQAIHTYQGARKAAVEADNKRLAHRITINLARAFADAGSDIEAAALLGDARRETADAPASHAAAFELIGIGRLYARLSETADSQRGEWQLAAHDSLHAALEMAEAINDRYIQSYALGYLGALYEQTGQYDEALILTQRATLLAQELQAAEILYRWQWQTGRILRATEEADSAILAYQRSIYTLQTIRQDLTIGTGGAQSSFRDSVGPVFFELADLLLERSASITDERGREQYIVDARETVELLKGAELEDYFQDDCAASLKAKTTGIDKLAPHTAAIYPIILPDRTELLLSLPDGLKRFSVPVDSQTMIAEVRAFRSRLEKRTTHQYLPHARQLYDWIIRPLETELASHTVNTLVIVPDGALRTVPMAALHDGSQFLAARYAIATTPGLTLTDPRPIEREEAQVLLTGLSESRQGFPALPNVDEELEKIGSLYDSTLLENQDFVVAKMEQALQRVPFSVVHIASHAQFDSEFEKTFLLTYDDKMNMDSLERFIGMTEFRENAVELLTLSACQTAAGDDRAALGLAGIAVKAGARSALATLWVVNDRASALLVGEFYSQLTIPTNSKAEALQRAQLMLMQDRRYKHPGYWSPFLLIGNWL